MSRLLPLLLVTTLAGALAAQPPGFAPGEAGAAAVWQKLRKLQTTASLLHTTAHPDDEHGGMLTMVSRGGGARVALLTLTRGESGDNAIGSELFDALGLVRTEELRLSNRYYGVDEQYFGTVADYGYSKRLDEALEKWGRDRVLRDIVLVLRTERPFVVVSRFQGNARDGHGNHAAAGLLTREAFRMAGDPSVYPDQIAAGLRPWQPLKLYIGGVRESEDWTLRVDAGEFDPVLGESYQTLARLGLSFQRSQTGGRFHPHAGPARSYYTRVDAVVDAPAKEESFFEGIDTRLTGLYRALRKEEPPGAGARLAAIEREIASAVEAFEFERPSAAAPALARAVAAARSAIAALGGDPDVRLILERKEQASIDALHAALGLSLQALAQPAGSPPPAAGPFGQGAPPMDPVVPGQTFEVRASFTNRGGEEVSGVRLALEAREDWRIEGAPPAGPAAPNAPVATTFTVSVPGDAAVDRPHYTRPSIRDAHYTIAEGAPPFVPVPANALDVVARYQVHGVEVAWRQPVVRLEADLPYGVHPRTLTVVPALAVSVSPTAVIAPLDRTDAPLAVQVEVVNNADGASRGRVRLEVPPGWQAAPAARDFAFARAGERAFFPFELRASAVEPREYPIEAVVSAGGREYREGYTTIRHRDLETRLLYRPARTVVRGVDVKVAPGLRVGYVMGVGDEVPAGLAQLGVDVTLLGEQELAGARLEGFNAIMTGTRAYAVREDLKTYNRRLLEYVEQGGNLIVLYNTDELVPDRHAPYPASLPRSAEEVSEEDSPVEILAPDAPVFSRPNRITGADFDGWVEQRGSKFWTAWDPRYTPMLASWDTGQAPQRGGWLHTRYGKGHYTYFAYALHRQLPYGVPGAYRLLANMLSLGEGKK